MRFRLKPLALIALCVIAALAVTACGGGGSHTVAPGAVADVSEKPISKSDFDHWLNVVVATQQAPGSKTKPKVPKQGSTQYEQLTRQVMQFLVSAQWITGEAAERNITGTDAEVKRQFAQTKSQSFPTDKAYKQFLKRSGQSQDDIMFRVRLDLLANKLREDITKDVSQVSDSSIEDYFKQNQQQFSQPERRDVEMVQTKTQDKANEALARLQKGEKFSKVAKELSQDPATKQQGGKLLGVVKGQQEKSLDTAFFTAVKGKLAGPVKTQRGFVVLRVNKITPAAKQSLDQSKEGIRQLLASQQQQKALDAFTTDFQKKWRGRTDCAKAYLTPECANGPEPPAQTAGQLPGAGPQPPAKTGTGVAPALGGSPAAAPQTAVPGSPAAAAPAGAPAAQGTGVPPALGGGAPAAGQQGVPQGAPPQGAQQQQQVPQQQQQQQHTAAAAASATVAGRRALAAHPSRAATMSSSAGGRTSEALITLDEVTRRLRRDCPWDREQDERSIVPHTVEEAYELADAAHSGDDAKLLDELGDVLFQVHFLALLLEERGSGDLAQVADGVTDKLVRRHPHVFGDEHEDPLAGLPTKALTAAEVRENWDVIKRTEPKDPLSGIPENLPALLHARKLQRRAAGGSDRGDPAGALTDLRARVEETAATVAAEGVGPEAQERTAHGSEILYERVGELLFTVVELARSLQVDPEIALRRCSERFRERLAPEGESPR